MPSKRYQKTQSGRTRGTKRLLKRLAVLSCSIASGAMGQSVLAPLPSIPGETPAVPAGNAATAGIMTGAAGQMGPVHPGLAGSIPGSQAAEDFLTWGVLHAKTHVTYQFLYGTGIQSSPGQAHDTITQTVNPGVALGLGEHWILDYEPSLSFFSESHFHNTLDQSLSLSGGATHGDWTFGLSQAYTRTDEPTVQTASQTGQQSYSGTLSASHEFNKQWSLEINGGVTLLFVDQSGNQISQTNSPGPPPITNAPVTPPLSDSQNYFASGWLNYQLSPKIGLAAGVTGGYSAQNEGLSSVNESFMGRIVLNPSEKLMLSADGGISDTRFLNSDAPDLWSPVYSASATYHLFEPTVFTLGASRSVQPSLFQDQVADNTSVNVGIRQRLLGKLQLTLGYSYIKSDYISSQLGSTQRSDEGSSYQVGLSTGFLKHGSVGTFYQYSQNSSTGKGFDYSSSQAGFTLTWAY